MLLFRSPVGVVRDRAARPADARTRPRISRRRTARTVVLVVLALVAAYALRPYYSQNLGVIDPGRAFRAAQPTSRLNNLIDELKLASILNLRGGDPEDSWYAHEVGATKSNQVDFYDLPLSAVRRPTRREMLLLIDVIASARLPILIHCRAGADRTGLATAVYKLMVQSLPPEEALGSFTAYHGHVPFFGAQHLQDPIEEYAAWLKAAGLTHSPERFRAWIRDDYDAEDPSIDPRPIRPGPRAEQRAGRGPGPNASKPHSG